MISLQEDFTPTCMAHPDTYINKVVIGSEEGHIQLWNFNTGKKIFETVGWGSAVRCISPSPALDIIGIGLADGRVVLYNVRYDTIIHSFGNASGAGMNNAGCVSASFSSDAKTPMEACTAIAFSTGVGIPLMAVGGTSGVITVWHLEEKRLSTVISNAHDGPVLSLFFFPASPILMSSSADNSIKQWIFDNTDGTARLLKSRCGHRAPPNCIKYYGEGYKILSGGQDRAFWMFSSNQAQQSREMSQGHTARKAKRRKLSEEEVKLSRVTQLDACEVRERDWANGITAHEGDWRAYTWRLKDFTIGDHVLEPPTGPIGNQGVGAAVTAVCLSCCGNFGFVGNALGQLHMFNMQSGLHRGEYRQQNGMAALPAHDGSVTGISADGCNRILVSGGYDGWLRFWHFRTKKKRMQVPTGSPISKLLLHPTTRVCAIVGDDLVVRIYDAEAGRLVRKFRGHSDRITDLEMSSDARWLMSSAMDGTVRVWDVPAGQTVQVMRLGTAVTALTLSPNMDMLATTHVNRRGIYLWSNQLIFGRDALMTPSDEPVDVLLPTVVEPDSEDNEEGDYSTIYREQHQKVEADSEHSERPEPDGEGRKAAPKALAAGFVTLSTLPRTQWHNLANLDIIQARNKPIQLPEKPEAAPFFLPSLPGVSGAPVFDFSKAAESEAGSQEDDVKGSKMLHGSQNMASEFLHLLRNCASTGDSSSFMAYLRTQSPAATDREIRSLEVLPADAQLEDDDKADRRGTPQEVEDLLLVLKFIDEQISKRENFEFIQALLKLVLNLHGESIMEWPALQLQAAAVKKRLASAWGRMEDLMLSVGCMVSYFSSLQG